MAHTRITTLSYTVKRLKDSGYNVHRLDSLDYTEDDKRKWSILIDNGVSSIIMTCFKNGVFHFYDGQRFLNSQLKLNTDSMKVLIEFLNSRGIINKHISYSQKE